MARLEKQIFIIACLCICFICYKYTDIVNLVTHNRVDDLKFLESFLKDWRSKAMHTLNMTEVTFYIQNMPVNVSLETWHNWNIMKLPKFKILPNYKNPCWMENHRPKITCKHVTRAGIEDVPDNKRNVEVLRCIPYFFLIGQPKCGTTDIYARLRKHPDVELWKVKEYFWFERKRFDNSCASIYTYLDFHLGNSEAIHNYKLPGTDYNPKIIGDCSVDVMWDNAIWPLLPGNQGCQEPCVTNPDMIHHLNPEARIIVSFRNPIERVFSDYLYESKTLRYRPSTEDFHTKVVMKITHFTDCLKTRSLRACVYNGTLENSIKSHVRLLQGLYSVHLTDWLRVFPRSQVHVVHFESYTRDIENNMASIFKFLGLRGLNSVEMKKIGSFAASNTRRRGREVGPMLNKTRKLLREFYKPYNKRLAQLLKEDRFLWVT